MEDLIQLYPGSLSDPTAIPCGTVVRDWVEDGVRTLVMKANFNLCVYFGIPLEHPLAHQAYDDLPIRCHGGLTFGQEGDGRYHPKGYYWYGYDYAHSGDFIFGASVGGDGKKWTIKELVDDSWSPRYNLVKLLRLAERIKNEKVSLS
jgi:hypothetical protein